jgi:hypothetical protein
MTPITASSHHAPAGEPHFRRRIDVAPPPPKARATPSIMPKTPRQRPTWRQNLIRNPAHELPAGFAPPNAYHGSDACGWRRSGFNR